MNTNLTPSEHEEIRVALRGCRDMLRESAKSHRLSDDPGHATMCDRHADEAERVLADLEDAGPFGDLGEVADAVSEADEQDMVICDRCQKYKSRGAMILNGSPLALCKTCHGYQTIEDPCFSIEDEHGVAAAFTRFEVAKAVAKNAISRRGGAMDIWHGSLRVCTVAWNNRKQRTEVQPCGNVSR